MKTRMMIPAATLLLAAGLPAQKRDEHVWDNLRELKTGQKIEIVQMNLKSESGAFQQYAEEGITLRNAKGEVAIAKDDVFRVSSLAKSHRLRNTLIGAAIGAGAGVAVGALIDSSGSESGEYLFTSLGLLFGGGGGAAAGAGMAGHPTVYRAAKRTDVRK
jgi:hypothetical protein